MKELASPLLAEVGTNFLRTEMRLAFWVVNDRFDLNGFFSAAFSHTLRGHRQPTAIRLPLRKLLYPMRPLLEQGQSIVDFGHFRIRRKAIEGWRENGAGFSGAAGRLVELGE